MTVTRCFETEFGTQQNIKRVDVAAMIARAVLTDDEIENAPASGFKDVPARAVKYINGLKAKGFINGKTDTQFGADAMITRGEVAMILARTYGLEGNVENLQFTDVTGHYKPAVAALLEHGITQGKSESSFGTTDMLTRGELAIFLYKVETLEVDTELAVTAVEAKTDNTKKVSKITATVTNAEEDATATIAIFGYDEDGAVNEEATLTKTDVAIENGSVDEDFDVNELSSGDYKAVVTVGEVEAESDFELDFTAVDAAVDKVNKANSEITLHNALQNSLFENYNENLIVEYLAKLGKDQPAQKTVASVQKVINEVNSMQDDAEFIKQLKEAGNQVQLLNLLSDFEAVDEDLLANYQEAIALDNAVLATRNDVQNLLYFINAEVALESLIATRNEDSTPATLVDDVTQADIDATQEFVDELEDGYALVSNTQTKENLQNDLDTVQALFTAAERAEAGLVANATELEAALENEELTKITLEDDIVVTNAITLSKDITLDGDGHTLSIDTVVEGATVAEGLLIAPGAKNVVVENIKITTATHTDNLIEIYGDATLKNVTASNGKKAGIYVNNDGTGTITVNFTNITTEGNAWKAGIGIVAQQEGSKVIANFSGTHSFGEETAVYTDDKTKYDGEYEIKGLTGYTKATVGNQDKWTKDQS